MEGSGLFKKIKLSVTFIIFAPLRCIVIRLPDCSKFKAHAESVGLFCLMWVKNPIIFILRCCARLVTPFLFEGPLDLLIVLTYRACYAEYFVQIF